MTISVFERVENTVRKGENAGNQHFLFFSQCFPKPSSFGSLKSALYDKALSAFSNLHLFSGRYWSLTHMKWQNFGLNQMESICRRKFNKAQIISISLRTENFVVKDSSKVQM